MKYLITKSNKVKVFPEATSHSSKAKKSEVKSAGYFNMKDGKINVYGKSHSYNILPRKNDAKLIEKYAARIR